MAKTPTTIVIRRGIEIHLAATMPAPTAHLTFSDD